MPKETAFPNFNQIQGRKKVTFDDIKRAMAMSVMPSDAALQEALSPKSASRTKPPLI